MYIRTGMGLGARCVLCAVPLEPLWLVLVQSPHYAALDEGLAGTATIRAFRAAPRLQAAQTLVLALALTLNLTPTRILTLTLT